MRLSERSLVVFFNIVEEYSGEKGSGHVALSEGQAKDKGMFGWLYT
jgi:hypothetical protein